MAPRNEERIPFFSLARMKWCGRNTLTTITVVGILSLPFFVGLHWERYEWRKTVWELKQHKDDLKRQLASAKAYNNMLVNENIMLARKDVTVVVKMYEHEPAKKNTNK